MCVISKIVNTFNSGLNVRDKYVFWECVCLCLYGCYQVCVWHWQRVPPGQCSDASWFKMMFSVYCYEHLLFYSSISAESRPFTAFTCSHLKGYGVPHAFEMSSLMSSQPTHRLCVYRNYSVTICRGLLKCVRGPCDRRRETERWLLHYTFFTPLLICNVLFGNFS